MFILNFLSPLQRGYQRERDDRRQVREQRSSGEEQHRQLQDSLRISSKIQKAGFASSSASERNSRK